MSFESLSGVDRKMCLRVSIVAVLGLMLSACLCRVSAQTSALVGTWKIELTLSEVRKHTLRFDASEGGRGQIVLMDPRSDLLPPAVPTQSAWREVSTDHFVITAQIEFPLGNVGREYGVLTLDGTLGSAPVSTVSGDATFVVGNSEDPNSLLSSYTLSGHFAGLRFESPTVEILSPGSGTRIRRGDDLSVQWRVRSEQPITKQEVRLSLDGGATFFVIGDDLDGSARNLTWSVPRTLIRTKKAFVKVLATDSKGIEGVGSNTLPFRIK